MKKKPKIKKYSKGGKFLDQTGEFALNGMRSTADIGLSMLGADNVIQDSDYTGAGANFARGYSSIMGKVGKAVAPMALSLIGIPPQVTSMGQKAISSSLNPMDEELKKQQEQQALYNQQMGYVPQQFAMGGTNGMPNAELENTEMYNIPNGPIGDVDGKSHLNGGVKVNIPNGTSMLPDNNDKLKVDKQLVKMHPGLFKTKDIGKTYSDVARRLKTTKEEKVLGDLSATPEALKTANFTIDLKKKMYDKYEQSLKEFKLAKLTKQAEKLGIQLPQANSQFANQGIQQFEGGGTYGNLTAQQAYDRDRSMIINANEPGLAPIYKNSLDESIDYNQTDVVPEDMGNFAPSINEMDWSQNASTPMNNSWIAPVVGGIIENIPSMIELAKGKKYDKVDYGKITPKLIDYSQSLKDARMQAAISRNQLKTAAGGNAGAVIANLGQLGAQNTANIANIIQSGENVNAGIINQANQANQEYKIKGMVDEAANKGAAFTNYNKAIASITSNPIKSYMDYKKGNMDMKTVGMLNQLSSKYGWNLNDKGDWELAVKALKSGNYDLTEKPDSKFTGTYNQSVANTINTPFKLPAQSITRR